jgi:hypothetical protein
MCFCNPSIRTSFCGKPGCYHSETKQEKTFKLPENFGQFVPGSTDKRPHICPVCVGKGEQKIESPYRENKYCSKCINIYLEKAKDSVVWSIEGVINRISDCESCKEIMKNTPMMEPCMACKGACVLWG